MCRSRLGMFAVVFACAATTALAGQKDVVRLNQARMVDDSGTPLAVLVVNPAQAELVAAAAVGSCRTVGDYLQVFSGTSRYRGNAYHIDTDVTLLEVQMELDIRVSTTLHFAVYQKNNLTGKWNSLTGSRTIAVTDPTPGPAFYSSGPMNLPLPGGFDYVMAFAWGADASISYGRDVPLAPGYPGATPPSFDVGLILGRVGTSISVPFPDTFASIGISGAGAHSMILCFEPASGACCSPSLGACKAVLEQECGGVTDPGAHFFGERTLCLDHVCDFGACCKPCGECLSDFTSQACAADGGNMHWEGAMCPTSPSSLCPPVIGACCRGDGTCSEVCEAQCVGSDAVYSGDGSTCNPNLCVGACCLPGTAVRCTEVTVSVCTSLRGNMRGLGTTCNNLSQGDECGGACCWGSGSLTDCRQVNNRVDCSVNALPGFQQAYRGDDTFCPVDCGVLETDYGACCMPDATCINMPSEADCSLAGGHFASVGQVCGDVNVQCLTAACCLSDGACEPLTARACVDRGGVPQVVATCGEASCITGACCESSEGRCTIMTAAACTTAGGLPGAGGSDCAAPATTCDAGLGLGACCVNGSFCLDALTATECSERNGAFSLGTTCETDPACDQRGACCTQTGICLFVTRAACEAAPVLGTFNGIGKACLPNSCLSGACCFDGGCTVTGETYCRRVDGLNGTYKGNGVTCTVNACIPSGACCVSGVCNPDQTPTDCVSAAGNYLGDNSTCAGDPCTLGACCNRGTCADLRIVSECPVAEVGVDFQAGQFCFQSPCEPFGACCFISGVCVDQMSQTQCQTSGGAFSQDALCTQVGCEPIGSCCFRDGTCSNALAQSNCEFQGGTLSGQETCALSDCPEIGACCLRDGTCEDNVARQDCETRRGTSSPDRTCDLIALCIPVGACCMPATAGSNCVDDKTRNDCQIAGGSYRGDGTDCPADGSNCGSCCSLSGCVDDVMSPECAPTDQQEDFLPGTTCTQRANQVACMPRGACCLSVGTCEILTETECTSLFGTFNGVATTCEQFLDLCLEGACCDVFQQAGAACVKRRRIDCEAIVGGVYQGADTNCDDITLCTVGSCCPVTGAVDCFADTVASECGDPSDFRPGQSTCSFCEGRGACCVGDDVPCEIRTVSQCAEVGMRYAGDGTVCPGSNEPQLCFVGACCDGLDGCTQQRRLGCELAGSSFRGVGAACGSVPCLEIIAIDPANCAIDPDQPSQPDGTVAQGMQSLVITFSADATGLLMEDLSIENQPGVITAPTITGIVVSGEKVTVDLDMPIPPGQWTCVTHIASGTKACVALLPGDVDGNALSVTTDVDALLADLVAPALPLRQCDIDRSGVCSPLDLMREIDLLLGAEQYDAWRDQTLPACPSVP